MGVVGRISELADMKSLLADDKAQLLAVIGRRRVGKTFLIREVYKEEKCFEMTGMKDASLKNQLTNFTFQLNHYFPKEELDQVPESWLLAFNALTKALKSQKSKKKRVVFFDEIPWIASKRSKFTEALAHWWNNWASQQNLVLVICGSAASWMIDHVVNAKGGLHNRITKLITLMPFTLKETKLFLESRNIRISDYQIIQLYIAVGGIPHYLEQVKKGKSAAQNIQEMCFSKDGLLRTEFDNLYPALFGNSGKHIAVIKALATKSVGLDRQEILKKAKMSDGGWFSDLLTELETSGFISSFQPLGKKKKETLFRLTDEYSLFYLGFIEGKKPSKDAWLKISQTSAYTTWCGYAFENLCMKHIDEIKHALGISGIDSAVYSFLHRADKVYGKGFQIDMLISRKDKVINICEMKFYPEEYKLDAGDVKKLTTRREGLRKVTGTKNTLFITFITTYGVTENKHKLDVVDHDLTMKIFF